MNILTELILEGRIYLSLSVIFGIVMGRNRSFFSLFGLWETFLSLGNSADALGGFGKLWGGFGRLWGCFGEGVLWEPWGAWLGRRRRGEKE